MTEQQFNQIPFRMVSHLALEHEHASTYINEEYGFSVCKHVKKKDDFTYGRTYIHYMYQGKVYKTKQKFLEAIKDVNPIGEYDIRKKSHDTPTINQL